MMNAERIAPGWETQDEQALLYALALLTPINGHIVEIGAEYGMSASVFAQAAHESVKITSIDLFPGDMLKKHVQNLRAVGVHRTRQITGDSKEVVQRWTERVDVLFIDGDHSYKGALADLQLWTPFVVSGGYVAVHDAKCETNTTAHHTHEEVRQAVDVWLANTGDPWHYVRSVDTTMLFQRRY